MPNMEKWKAGRVTISRLEYGKIVSKNLHELLSCANLVDMNGEVTNMLRELIIDFSASVAADVFSEERTLEEG